MYFLNFCILFLQETRGFLGSHFGMQCPILVYIIFGLQSFLFFTDLFSNKFYMPKIGLLLFVFAPLYLYNNLALHCIFIILNIINLRKITLKQIVRYIFIIQIFFLFLSFAILFLGIVNDTIWRMPKGVGHTLGFRNPNGTSSFLTNELLIFSLFLLICKKINNLDFILIIPAYIIYKVTCGRTYFIGILFYILFLILFRFKIFYRHNYKLYSFAPLLLGALLIVGIKVYEQYPIIDLLFSKRLSWSKAILDEFSLINYFIGTSYVPDGLTVDSSYLFIVCEAGIISVTLFMMLYTSFVRKTTSADAKVFYPFIFFILIAGVTEITFPTFSTINVIFYKILYETARKRNLKESLL